MNIQGLPDGAAREPIEQQVTEHVVGLRASPAAFPWGVTAAGATCCGALAANRLHWQGEDLLVLGLVLLLTVLAWGSLWNVGTGTLWFHSLARGRLPAHPVSLPALPYTLPGSPGGRLLRGLEGLVAWWRGAFWPAAGAAFAGLLTAAALTVLLSLLLPGWLRPLYAALVALVGLGIVQRQRGRDLLAGQSLLHVGLSWLAGHAAFARPGLASVSLALAFTVAVVGVLQVAQGLAGGFWLLNGAIGAVMVMLVALEHPLAAGVVGLILFGQVALQLSLRVGDGVARVGFGRRTWPWLMAAMLTAALAVA